MEIVLKKKFKETNPVKNLQAKKPKVSIQDFQETSTTFLSQPAANKTVLFKRPQPGDNLSESMNMSKRKKVQTS